MAVITTRAGKGSPLTNAELDANFTNINAELATAAITGGTINGATIGGVTPAAGSFTNLNTTGNTTLGDATSDTITATGRFNTDLVPSTDNARDLGTASLKWKQVYAVTGSFTDLSTTGNTTLGDATADTITANGRFNTDLVPSTDNARDLGTSALKWKQVYATGFTENGFAVVSQTDIGSAPNQIPLNQYLGDLAYQTAAAVNITGGVATLTSGTFGAGTASLPSITTVGDTNTGIFFPAADNIGFATNGVIRGRWTTDGLCFGSDTAAANALDDYEEGTYTATLTCGTSGTITLGTSTLAYTKIGRVVTVTGYLGVSSVASPVGAIEMNLPFTILNSLVSQTGGFFLGNDLASGNVLNYWLYANSSLNRIEVFLGGSTSVSAASAQTVKANTEFRVFVSYFTS